MSTLASLRPGGEIPKCQGPGDTGHFPTCSAHTETEAPWVLGPHRRSFPTELLDCADQALAGAVQRGGAKEGGGVLGEGEREGPEPQKLAHLHLGSLSLPCSLRKNLLQKFYIRGFSTSY